MLVLARVKAFLPIMATSTQELLKKKEENPDDVDIENTEGDERVIAMVCSREPCRRLHIAPLTFHAFGGQLLSTSTS